MAGRKKKELDQAALTDKRISEMPLIAAVNDSIEFALASGGLSSKVTWAMLKQNISFPVVSVNSKTGAVSLTYIDVGAAATVHQHAASDVSSGQFSTDRLGAGTANSGTYLRGDGLWSALPAAPVTSVNGLTGAVSLNYSTVGAAAASHTHDAGAIATGVINVARLGAGAATSGTYLRGDGQWAAVPAAPVVSVNGQTGAVNLDYNSVGAAASNHTHAWPVTSVNGQTGAVSLDYNSVGAAASNHTHSWPVTSVNSMTGAVSLNYASVGAAAASHTHSEYVPIAGGTMTGLLTLNGGYLQIGSTAGQRSAFNFLGQMNRDGGTYYDILNASNYTSYTVGKTGAGASGTWGISITGNAATASNGGVTSVNGMAGAVTLNYASVGAPSTTGANASGTWGINITGNANYANSAGSVNGYLPLTGGTLTGQLTVNNVAIVNSNIFAYYAAIGGGDTTSAYQGMGIRNKVAAYPKYGYIDFNFTVNSGSSYTQAAHIFATQQSNGQCDLAFGATPIGAVGSDRRQEVMRCVFVGGNGNPALAIGRTTASSVLHVQGNATITAIGGSGTLALYVMNDGSLTNKAPSDQKLKDGIVDYQLDVEQFMMLRPRRFYWIPEYHSGLTLGERADYGFVAQELAEVIPESVGPLQNEDGTDKVIDGEVVLGYTEQQMKVMVIAMLQHHQREIEELKKLIPV